MQNLYEVVSSFPRLINDLFAVHSHINIRIGIYVFNIRAF